MKSIAKWLLSHAALARHFREPRLNLAWLIGRERAARLEAWLALPENSLTLALWTLVVAGAFAVIVMVVP